MMEETNATEHYERIKTTFDLKKNPDILIVKRRHLTSKKTLFDLYKDDI